MSRNGQAFVAGSVGAITLCVDAALAWAMSYALPLTFWQAMILAVGLTAHANHARARLYP